jgi:Ca-activated chloride channel family protein
MNASNDNHEPTTLDDFCDRLADRGLAEIVGREIPPDLRERILAAAVPVGAASGSTEFAEVRSAIPTLKRGPRRAFWGGLATAAMLLVGATMLLLPDVQSARQATVASARKDRTPVHSYSQTPTSQPKRDTLFAGNVETATSATNASDAQTVVGREWSQLERKQMRQSMKRSASPEAPSSSRVEAEEVRFAEVPREKFTIEAAPESQVPRYIELYNPNQREDVLRGINRPIASDGSGTQATKMLVTPRIITQSKEEERLSLESWPDKTTGLGTGPGLSGDQYTRIVENPFVKAEGGAAVSTFSIDVDTASYANVRQFLMQMNTLPPPDAVRIEELINYFDYNYAPPISPADPVAYNTVMATARAEAALNGYPPFAAHVEVAGCPWAAEHRLVRIGIKGRELDRAKRPKSNLVFLVDVSGSMDDPAKLPLVVYGLEQLTRELGENDRVAIVVYASSEGLVLPSTHGDKQDVILAALGRLQAGGSTAGGAGIQLAYQLAEDNFIEGGTNRVILCTDGDFNVGVTSTAELQRMVEQKAKDTRVFLSVLGFGRGNLNDAMMEAISNHGNGNYHYVDNRAEARRVLVKEMAGTLVTIAKDVKIQVEFNPQQVAGYRLIGYENRMLRTEDFNDDKKDAGEIGAGHTVTALYEIVPAGKQVAISPVDELKYQQPPVSSPAGGSAEARPQPPQGDADSTGELLTLKMRYKQPDGDTSRKLEWPVADAGQAFAAATGDFQFATAVAGFGLLLRDSQYKGNLTYAAVLELAQPGVGSDEQGHRGEFLEMVRRAKTLRGE